MADANEASSERSWASTQGSNVQSCWEPRTNIDLTRGTSTPLSPTSQPSSPLSTAVSGKTIFPQLASRNQTASYHSFILEGWDLFSQETHSRVFPFQFRSNYRKQRCTWHLLKKLKIVQTKEQEKMKPQPFVKSPIKSIIFWKEIFRQPFVSSKFRGAHSGRDSGNMMRLIEAPFGLFLGQSMCPHQGECKIH